MIKIVVFGQPQEVAPTYIKSDCHALLWSVCKDSILEKNKGLKPLVIGYKQFFGVTKWNIQENYPISAPI